MILLFLILKNGALSYDKFGQTLLLLVGREAAVKIAESIKKEEMKTAPNPTAPGVIARPPGPPGQLGAPMMGILACFANSLLKHNLVVFQQQ